LEAQPCRATAILRVKPKGLRLHNPGTVSIGVYSAALPGCKHFFETTTEHARTVKLFGAIDNIGQPIVRAISELVEAKCRGHFSYEKNVFIAARFF
jgi:hypothetical protein